MREKKSALPAAQAALFVLTLLASACAPQAPADVPPGEVTGSLTVLDWAGYDAPDFWIDFQNTYPNVNVNFEIGSSDADIYAKMKAGDQADIFHPYTGWLQFYVDEGLVEEIDTSQAHQLGQGARHFQEDRSDQRQAVFHPLGLGIHLYSLSHRQGPGRRSNSWAALMDPQVRRPYLHVG